jgi:YegS/Rv2252/BmrU family lipid kinase
VDESAAVTPYERKEAVVVINPAAHNVPSPKHLQEAAEWLRVQGWEVSWQETHESGDATRMAADAAAKGVPLLIAFGGDGTVNEVANGLAGSQTVMGTVPSGTSNIWAREAGLDGKPLDAVQRIILGERRQIDLGRAGDRYFVLFAGFGIDAAVTKTTPQNVKDRLGAAAYAISAARQALGWKSKPIRVRIDGVEREMEVLMAFAGNTRLYAGITRITPTAVADDGKLDVCVYSGRGRRDILFHAARTLLQLHRKSPKVLYRRASRIEFDWDEPLPAQVDGDALDVCPHEVSVAPLALWVAVPAGFVSPMFSRPAHPGREHELSLPPR